MKISEMITDRYKLRIPPTVYYDLLADVQEMEDEQRPKFIAKSDGTIEQIKNCNDCLFKKEWEKIGKLLSVVLEKQTEQEPTTKNDLGVDCVSREKVLKLIYDYKENHSNDREHYPINYGTLLDMIRWVCDLPSVTPQELQTFKWCTDCKEYDQEKHCCHRWSKVIRDTVEEMKQEYIKREVLDKIRAQIEDYLRGVEITLDVLVENDPLRPKMEGAKDTLEECLNLIDKVESEDKG